MIWPLREMIYTAWVNLEHIMLSERSQSQKNLVQKPVIPNLDLIPDLTALSNSPRKIIFINQSGTFWSTPMR